MALVKSLGLSPIPNGVQGQVNIVFGDRAETGEFDGKPEVDMAVAKRAKNILSTAGDG